MNEAEGEAAETQVWLEYAAKCEYMSRDDATRLHKKYNEILGKLVNMGTIPKSGYSKRENDAYYMFSFSRFRVFKMCLC